MASGKPYPPGILERLQRKEIELLRVFDKVCRDNNISYFIIAGTLLGAVRHGGFIPWDDDIDIGMSEKDYRRFLKIAPTVLPKGYSLHNTLNTPGFTALWTKIYIDGTEFADEHILEAGCKQGIFIDIIPFFRLDKNVKKAWKQCRRAKKWQQLSYLRGLSHPNIPKNERFARLKYFGCILMHYTIAQLFSPAQLQNNWERSYYLPDEQRGQYWMNGSYIYKELLPESSLFPVRDIKFGPLTVMAPQDPDFFLKSDYGYTYMEFPPLEDRYTHLPYVLDFGDGINVMKGWI
ncbi:phosphorylcholine transferase LicD [uncultured Olegusella sp.]|uniref:LicD family protein n=1 Tax=uncultured Olegusella sp. TaxID=1979846 RepID=UPI0026080EB4|nr:LicD family protein [uncultured Olegusella sp.]